MFLTVLQELPVGVEPSGYFMQCRVKQLERGIWISLHCCDGCHTFAYKCRDSTTELFLIRKLFRILYKAKFYL